MTAVYIKALLSQIQAVSDSAVIPTGAAHSNVYEKCKAFYSVYGNLEPKLMAPTIQQACVELAKEALESYEVIHYTLHQLIYARTAIFRVVLDHAVHAEALDPDVTYEGADFCVRDFYDLREGGRSDELLYLETPSAAMLLFKFNPVMECYINIRNSHGIGLGYLDNAIPSTRLAEGKYVSMCEIALYDQKPILPSPLLISQYREVLAVKFEGPDEKYMDLSSFLVHGSLTLDMSVRTIRFRLLEVHGDDWTELLMTLAKMGMSTFALRVGREYPDGTSDAMSIQLCRGNLCSHTHSSESTLDHDLLVSFKTLTSISQPEDVCLT